MGSQLMCTRAFSIQRDHLCTWKTTDPEIIIVSEKMANQFLQVSDHNSEYSY